MNNINYNNNNNMNNINYNNNNYNNNNINNNNNNNNNNTEWKQEMPQVAEEIDPKLKLSVFQYQATVLHLLEMLQENVLIQPIL